MKLLKTDTLEEAIAKLNSKVKEETMEVDLLSSLGKVLAEDIVSKVDVPNFDRSVVDGYALRSKDTSGASETIPTFLKLVGEVEMGEETKLHISSGECAYVPTGAMIPSGADSVVMVEYTEKFTDNEIAVYQSVSNAKGMTLKGDDIKKGEEVLLKGRRIGSSEIGVLASIGKERVLIEKTKKISIISTGDELVSLNSPCPIGKVRDINSYTISSYAKELGFEVVNVLKVKDDKEELKKVVSSEMKQADIVAISGGSSQGKKDVTESVIDELSSTGVLTHGISIKPGKPTITGYDENTNTILIGLPGHPQAALIIFKEFFSKRGLSILAKISMNIPSAPGRKTIQLVTLEKENGEMLASPIISKSGMINAVAKADGYILTDINCEGINKGETVEVFLLR